MKFGLHLRFHDTILFTRNKFARNTSCQKYVFESFPPKTLRERYESQKCGLRFDLMNPSKSGFYGFMAHFWISAQPNIHVWIKNTDLDFPGKKKAPLAHACKILDQRYEQ